MVKHMTKERAQQHLDNIMDNFDFEEVHETMESLDWSWAPKWKVPNIEELKDTVERLFWKCFESTQDEYTWSTGGFEVTLYKELDKANCKFVVDSWSSDGEYFEN